ncbi:DNA-processing protein DprA [Jeongeupia naejangsanensis]|uniref:DNA-protecting protein DprA n=1 Tax=Jeongeupia naejangsanensis TaxID=613195 RepID=A0ABS2BNJ9_9NEIS|nr:DNA-processing protein DprA [Jeongeupia naejangsanensis]MBM3117202.1 DNA-protecting protein DprA [Jeongeupia naejangsanensis]
MAETDLVDWLRFSTVPGIGPRRQLALLHAFGEPGLALAASEAALREHLPESLVSAWRAAAAAPSPQVDATLAWLQTPATAVITLGDANYPARLLDLPDPPVLLYLKGCAAQLQGTMLGVVGSRGATPQGIANARAFSAALSVAGLGIVSGLAAGIDAAAHEGGLDGTGGTIAIVGTGLDRVYPAGNRALAHRIAEAGLLVSEFPLGAPPKAEHFPRRNRLIAALSHGVLVVEAALGSGSLITARQAVELGREVFAIPGSIHSPQSRGCHRLIKDGAKLVESADDVLDELDWQARLLPQQRSITSPPQRVSLPPTPTSEAGVDDVVLSALGHDPADLDALVVRSGLTVEQLCAILLGLELTGRVATLPGGRYQRLA